MGSFLHAIGAFSARRRWTVITAWLVLLVGVGIAAISLRGPSDDSFSIPGTPSVATYERMGELFPGSGGATGTVVLRAPDGATIADPDFAPALAASIADLSVLDDVVAVADPLQAGAVSPSGTIAYITVTYGAPTEDLADTALEDARAATSALSDAGLQVELTGSAYFEAHPVGGIGEIIGLFVAVIVLYVTLRAVAAAALPFVTGVAAVGLGVGGVTALTGFVTLPSTAPILAMMLGLAVGIDYSLFILARHRSQVLAGVSVRESIARANGTAGAAVVFAGSTVIVALLALVIADIPFLTAMGNAAAATVALAVLAALTLLPAVMSLAGLKVLPRKQRAQVQAGTFDATHAEPQANRWALFVTRRPIAVLVAGIVALGVLAIPAMDMRLGLPTDASQPEGSSARAAYELLAEGFGPGFNGPIVVLAETDNPATGTEAVGALSQEFGALANVAAATPPIPNADGTAFLITVLPTTGPDAVETEGVVRDIRSVEAGANVEFGVTGATAIRIDVAEGIADALPLYLAVVVGLALLLLLVVFRSVLIPLKALLGFLLTLAATTGALVAVFQWGWLGGLFQVAYAGPIIAFLPIIAIGITFGLAMDYEVFLVSRMREEHLGGASPLDSIIVGYSHTARVVVAAALIMASVFFGFMLDDDVIIKSIGFALAFAVLIDAFVVRMTLVPAAMALLGKAAWWLPGWLDRIVPHIHFEGDPEEAPEQAQKELAPV